MAAKVKHIATKVESMIRMSREVISLIAYMDEPCLYKVWRTFNP